VSETPKSRRWVVIDDSGYDDCTLSSFVSKNEAVAYVKETLASVDYQYDSVTLLNMKDRSKDKTFYATEEQRRQKRDYKDAENARYAAMSIAAEADRESGFHWRDSWFFKRFPDGSVRVTKLDKHKNVQVSIIIPPNEWASIVCSVSAGGETGERWNAAQDFHGRVSNQEKAPLRKVSDI
jgi:hypothetical protein